MRIAFIGGGVMAQAIISGVKDADLGASIIAVSYTHLTLPTNREV